MEESTKTIEKKGGFIPHDDNRSHYKKGDYAIPIFNPEFRADYHDPDQLVDIVYIACVDAMTKINDNLGKTLTQIDVLGLPEQQGKSLKQMIKQLFRKDFVEASDILIQMVQSLNQALYGDYAQEGYMTIPSAIYSIERRIPGLSESAD
jgi:hypothetical protein